MLHGHGLLRVNAARLRQFDIALLVTQYRLRFLLAVFVALRRYQPRLRLAPVRVISLDCLTMWYANAPKPIFEVGSNLPGKAMSPLILFLLSPRRIVFLL